MPMVKLKALFLKRSLSSLARNSSSCFRLSLTHLGRRNLARTPSINLNRILVERHELLSVAPGEEGTMSAATAVIPKSDPRAVHVSHILGLQDGDSLRWGVVDGAVDDFGRVRWSNTGDLMISSSFSASQMMMMMYQTRDHSTVRRGTQTATEDGESPDDVSHLVDMILALPRPAQMARILSMVGQLGVCRLFIVGASKVPKDYWGINYFRNLKFRTLDDDRELSIIDFKKPGSGGRVIMDAHIHNDKGDKVPHPLRVSLIDGLSQSGATRLPLVYMFVGSDLDSILGNIDSVYASIQEQPGIPRPRFVAHPRCLSSYSFSTMDVPPMNADHNLIQNFTITSASSFQDLPPIPSCLLAIGPEGGWDEPDELAVFLKHGFHALSAGPRVLRTDVACVALITLCQAAVSRFNSTEERFRNETGVS